MPRCPSLIASLLLVLPAGSVGCRGFVHDTGPYAGCDTTALDPGRVRARRLPCDDEAIDGGEGRRADWVIENAYVRFVVRHPGAPLTLLGLAGGTVIDAAPVGGEDCLIELVPLVEGGWLDRAELAVEQDSDHAAIEIVGTPAPIPFLASTLEPGLGSATVRYVLGPDDKALTVEGVEGFWLLPMAGAERSGATLRSEGCMVAVDGEAEDFGGGVRYHGGGLLAAGEPEEVLAALWPGGEQVSGSTAGEGVEILAGATPVGWLPVDDDGAFEGILPAGADGLRALADGYAAGPVVAVGQDLELPLGGEGRVGVRVLDRAGSSLSARATAVDAHGHRRVLAVEPEGSWLPLGAGRWEIELDAGPLYARERYLLAGLSGEVEIDVVLDGPGAPPGWALADLRVEASPSRVSRTTPERALGLAASGGVDFAVVVARDEVASAAIEQPWDARLATASGSWAVSDDQGSVLAWPYSSNVRKPAHGAVAWSGLSAEDILRVAAGTQAQQRLLAVDAAWIQAAGPALAWDPVPDMLTLADADEIPLLLELYDAWVDLTPTGPLTWLWLEHAEQASTVEYERALIAGRSVATTGPLIALEVDGQAPGSLVSGRGPVVVDLRLWAPRDTPLAGLALIVDGVEVERWDLTGQLESERLAARRHVLSERYVLAFAWGPEGTPGSSWVVTAPVWTGRP
jgi:hypothetical protein